MNVLYHGSSLKNLGKLEPRKSTHGVYVYATPYKELAIHFCKRCGDDLTYSIGHYSQKDVWELVEKVPGALEKMYATDASIYTVDIHNFKDIHSGFAEMVSEESVEVLSEEYIDDLYSKIMELQEMGIIKIYRFPSKPKGIPEDNSDILDKWRFYKNQLNHDFEKRKFDRLLYLYPYLLDKINELLIEFKMDFQYKKEDIVSIFKQKIDQQLQNKDYEQYVDCAYTIICETYPELKQELDGLYKYYEQKNKNKQL